MDSFYKIVQYLSDKLKMVGAVCLVGMSLLTCVDVVGRMFRHPVFGSVELVSLMGVMAVALALPHTHATHGHIGVELLVRRMPRKRQALIDLCTGLVSLCLFAVAAWRMAVYGFNLKASGEVSMNLELPEYLIVLVVALSFFVLCAVIITTVVDAWRQVRPK